MIRGIAASPQAGLAFAVLIWSGNFVVGRALRHSMSPLSINFLRWTIALAILLPLTRQSLRRHRGLIVRHWKLVVALGLTGIAAFQTLVYVALSTTSAVNALLLLSLAPLAIAAASWVVLGDRMSGAQLPGMAASFAGAIVLVTHGRASAVAALGLGAGELWMLLAVALWTVYSLLLKRAPRDLPQSALLAATSTVAVVSMLPFLFLLPSGVPLPTLGWQAWAGLLYIGLVASVPPFVLWQRGVARIGPSRAGSFIYLMPVFGAALAFVFLGEGLRPYQLGGAAAIFAGIAATNRGARAGSQ